MSAEPKLALDGYPVNPQRAEETFTYEDLITANLNGVKRGRALAEQDARDTIEILRHNLKTALMALDGKYKLESWQREILDQSAGENDERINISGGNSVDGGGCGVGGEDGHGSPDSGNVQFNTSVRKGIPGSV